MRARTMALAAAVTLAGVAVGCGGSSETFAPATTAPTTTTTTPKSFAVDTPDGQVSLSLDGKLPPNWPASFPLPPGAKPAGSGSLGGAASTVMVGAFTSTGGAEDAFNFYKNDPGVALSNTSTAGVGKAFIGKGTLGGIYAGSVSVVGRGDATYIVVVLKSAGAGSGGTVPGSTPGTTAGTTPGSTPGTTAAVTTTAVKP